MMRMKLVLVGVTLACLAGGVTQAQAAITAAPLHVKVSTYDGGNKVQLAKKVKGYVSCSKDCRLTTHVKIISPINTISRTYKFDASAEKPVLVGFIMTKSGLNYLKDAYRNCRFKITASAVDVETGKRTIRTRLFKFKR